MVVLGGDWYLLEIFCSELIHDIFGKQDVRRIDLGVALEGEYFLIRICKEVANRVGELLLRRKGPQSEYLQREREMLGMQASQF